MYIERWEGGIQPVEVMLQIPHANCDHCFWQVNQKAVVVTLTIAQPMMIVIEG